MSELDPLNPGQILKHQREKMGLSLNDIAVATKINPKILKALEDGQKEVLPPRSFVRGFIRSYANYLKLKPEPILEAFEMGDSPIGHGHVTETEPSPAKSSRSDVSRLEKSSRVGTIMVAVGIVVLIVLIFGVKSMMDKYASERVVDKPAAEATSEETQDVSATTDTPADATTAGASDATTTETTDAAAATAGAATTAAPAAAAIKPVVDPKAEAKALAEAKAAVDAKVAADKKADEEKAIAEKKIAAEKLAADRKIAADKLAAEKKAAAEAKALAATEAKPEVKAPAKPGVPQEVIIEALDDVQITVNVDSGGSKKINLKPDSVYTVKAKSDVSLEVSDGGLVNIIHNGNDKGNPGTLGKAAKVKYP